MKNPHPRPWTAGGETVKRASSKVKLGLLAILFCGGTGLGHIDAQTVVCGPRGSSGQGCLGYGIAGPESVVTGEPYQAQAVTQHQQLTADGTHISQTNTSSLARDSEGRTMRTDTLGGIGPGTPASGSSGANSEPVMTTIFDPVANQHIDYLSNSTVAHVITMREMQPGGGFSSLPASAQPQAGSAPPIQIMGMSPAPPMAGGGFVVEKFAGGPSALRNTASESLGTKTVDGLSAVGTRSTTTIPSGTIGNDKPIVITQETWYSPDLKLVLESTHNDPRYGETTYTVTNLLRSEPDESLFQVPPGYTIDHGNGQVMIATPTDSATQ
jgi:hypothetical protein